MNKEILNWIFGLLMIILGFSLLSEFIIEFAKITIGIILVIVGLHFLRKKNYQVFRF